MKTKHTAQSNPFVLAKAFLALLLAAALVPFVPHTVEEAEAVEIEDNLGNGFGLNTTVAFDGRLWIVVGYNGAGIRDSDTTFLSATGDKTATLLYSKSNSGADRKSTKFSKWDNKYSTSLVKELMDNIAADGQEQPLIVPRTLVGGSGNYGTSESPLYNPYNIAGDTVSNALYWPLSTGEALSLSPSTLSDISTWWLRSPGASGRAACAELASSTTNTVNDFGTGATGFPYYIRPACKLNLSSVFFTSAADAVVGKNSVGVSSGLSSVGSIQSGKARKLVVKDSDTTNVNLTSAAADNTTVKPGDNVAITYTGAQIGTGKYLSAILKTSGGTMTHYGKLENLSTTASGSASFTVPDGLTPGTYTLLVFNEQQNDVMHTDFASNPQTIALTVAAPITQHTITASAGAGGTISPQGSVLVDDAGSQSFAITADADYRVKDVVVDGSSQGARTSYEFADVTADHTIEASFEAIPVPEPTHADPDKDSIAPDKGIVGGGTVANPFVVTADSAFELTVTGDRCNAPGEVTGDTRDVPISWSVNPSGTFPEGGPYLIDAAIKNPGDYVLTINYRIDIWNGTAWVDADQAYSHSYTVRVDASPAPNPKPDDPKPLPNPSSDNGKKGLANTGDTAPYLPMTAALSLLGLIIATSSLIRRARKS